MENSYSIDGLDCLYSPTKNRKHQLILPQTIRIGMIPIDGSISVNCIKHFQLKNTS